MEDCILADRDQEAKDIYTVVNESAKRNRTDREQLYSRAGSECRITSKQKATGSG